MASKAGGPLRGSTSAESRSFAAVIEVEILLVRCGRLNRINRISLALGKQIKRIILFAAGDPIRHPCHRPPGRKWCRVVYWLGARARSRFVGVKTIRLYSNLLKAFELELHDSVSRSVLMRKFSKKLLYNCTASTPRRSPRAIARKFSSESV